MNWFKKKIDWVGIKNDCCTNQNIITNINTNYGQCIICLRLFEKRRK